MFNNDMNNNQNFNNGNPTFNQNNIGANNMNNSYDGVINTSNYGAPSYDNMNNNQNFGNQNPVYGNPNLNNNMFNMNINSEPLFNNQPNGMFPGFEQVNSQIVSSDVPPELDPIKNLNDAVESTAPTLDVLGPMNIMPDVLPQTNDNLDAYENGTYDINNQSLNTNSLEQNSYQPGTNDISNPLNNFDNNIIQNINEPIQNFNPVQETTIPLSSPMNQNSDFPSELPNLGSSYEPINTALNNDINIDQPNNAELPSMDTSLDYGINNDLPASDLKPEFDSVIDPLNSNEIETPVINSLDNTHNISDTISLNTNSVIESTISDVPDLAQDVILSEPVEEDKLEDINEEFKETEDLNTNLEEISDTNLEETNLSDLGLDESYTEPDVLEIMDLDNDVKEELEEETDESDESFSSKGLVSKNVEKIKSLIEELKASGVDIELEEFDFESMYQLIVKLKK